MGTRGTTMLWFKEMCLGVSLLNLDYQLDWIEKNLGD
jgi:hypothetical protein